jgi:hypothetical protein
LSSMKESDAKTKKKLMRTDSARGNPFVILLISN